MKKKIKDGLLSGYLRKARFNIATKYLKGKNLLDIGCDEGHIIPFIPKKIKYSGLERNEAMLIKAKKKYPKIVFHDLEINPNNISNLKLGKYDNILLLAVIEHMNNPIKFLLCLNQLLNEKGRIIITSPSKSSDLILRIMSFFRLARNDKHEHEFYVNNKMMSKLYKSGKFKKIKYKKFQFGLNQLWVIEKV
jgi:2-polyprenyl-3-methyl-5-hydroxy-6-metoxy-1,4-benzoquinol methylase